jgi:hypothetical protein
MKKFITLLASVAFLLFLNPVQAQPYSEGSIQIDPGISFGLIGYGWGWAGSSSFTLPLHASLSYHVTDRIGVGPYAGYMRRTYRYNVGSSDWKNTFSVISFGAQGIYHATPFLNETFDMNIDEDKIDWYVRVLLGYEVYSWNYDSSWTGVSSSSSGRVVFGPVFGIRYMLNPKIGLYGEGGRGAFGWLNVGVSFNL